jgi:hypothetical protein
VTLGNIRRSRERARRTTPPSLDRGEFFFGRLGDDVEPAEHDLACLAVQGEPVAFGERVIADRAAPALLELERATADEADRTELAHDHRGIAVQPPEAVKMPAAAAKPAASSVELSGRTRITASCLAASALARCVKARAGARTERYPRGHPAASKSGAPRGRFN